MRSNELDRIVKEAEGIAAGDYKEHETTRRNHAKLMSLQIKVNTQLIKTIRELDTKNSKLQMQVYILSIIATICAIIAIFK